MEYGIEEMLHCLYRCHYNAAHPMVSRQDRRPRQLDLLCADPEREAVVAGDRRRHLRGRLAEMLRAYFWEILRQENDGTDASREDSGRP